MNWIEVALETDGEAAEAIADLLQQYGYQGVAIEQLGIDGDAWLEQVPHLPDHVIIRSYLPAGDQEAALKQKLEDGLYHLRRIYPLVPEQPTYTTVKEEDWAEAWKAHYKPLRIGQRFYIRPDWVDEQAEGENRIEIVLDPGMAFGTGTHPSTQLCLLGLEAQAHVPARVLDLGCGSGVLSIAAGKLGATDIHALDIDRLAVESTQENAARNGVLDLMTIQQGSLTELLDRGDTFDLILVNILAKIIIPMCEQGLGRVVRPGGIAVFSGIIDTQADDVEAALRQTGLTPYRRHTMGDWIGIEARKES